MSLPRPARRGPGGIVALAVWLAVGIAHAGAWTLPRGEAYHRLAAGHLVADTEFDEDGERSPFQFDGEFTDTSLSYYGEYGLRDGWTVLGFVPVKDLRYDNFVESGQTGGVADVELGVRRRLGRRPVALAFQALVKLPHAYDGSDRLPLGNDQVDTDLRVLLGHAPGRGRIYYGVEAGYRFRRGAPSDEERLVLELGSRLAGKLSGRVKYDALRSADNADDVRDVFGNPVATLAAELDRVEATLTFAARPRWGVEATWRTAVSGRGTADAAAVEVALILSR